MDGEQPTSQSSPTTVEAVHLQPHQIESTRAALALLLGPETDYALRVRAARKVAKQGPAILPLLLTTLSSYPEITSPAWPWWPPQYEHCSRLLLHFSHKLDIPLEEFLHHSALMQTAGPVLWISVIEAAALLPHGDHEELLAQGIETPWATTRYAAAMALAGRASKGSSLHPSTLAILQAHQDENEVLSVRVATCYALLTSGVNDGVEVLLQLLDPDAPEEARKAAAFLFAAELPLISLSRSQRERLAHLLVLTLRDPNSEVGLHAARALRYVALPSILSPISEMLVHNDPDMQIRALTALEEVASQEKIRSSMQQKGLPATIAPLLRSDMPEIRRQASYTLAAIGGEYVLAVLGSIVLNKEHEGHIEGVEGLRLLHGVLRNPIRATVVRWLLQIVRQSPDVVQITALDSLAYLLWQTRASGQKYTWEILSHEIMDDGSIMELLHANSAWVRQRAVELATMAHEGSVPTHLLHAEIQRLLHTDSDSEVRACVAALCGQKAVQWAIPDLIQALLDPDEQVAITALHALDQLATPEDSLVMAVIEEVVHFNSSRTSCTHTLVKEAETVLKKWRKLRKAGT